MNPPHRHLWGGSKPLLKLIITNLWGWLQTPLKTPTYKPLETVLNPPNINL